MPRAQTRYNTLTDSCFWQSLQQRTDLSAYGNLNAALYALELRVQHNDICSIASDIITEGGDDENIDILFVDEDNGAIYAIQSFQSPQLRHDGARPNKARDSSYACTALFDMDIDTIPDRIKNQVKAARAALASGSIKSVYIWFLNNCPEKDENARIMSGIGQSAVNSLRHKYPEHNIVVSAKEVGLETLDSMYKDQLDAILVTEKIAMNNNPGFIEYGINGWVSFCTSLPGRFLKELYDTHTEEKLFSANVRNYMGSNKKDQYINGQIQESAIENPEDFFVCNNGITALVHDLEISYPIEGERLLGNLLSITGISIVNGAQTTGCLSNLTENIDPNVRVHVRFIKVEDQVRIDRIIRANNSQNKVLASDFRSGDTVQKRLRNEFRDIADSHYMGGLRTHLTPAEKRISLDPEKVAQTLIAYHHHANSSYHEKKQIWENDDLYNKAFPGTISAGHVIFVYALNDAITEIKAEYATQFRHGTLRDVDRAKHEFLALPGVYFLIIHAISSIMEMIVGEAIPDSYTVSFKENISRKQAVALWKPVVLQVIKRTQRLKPAAQNRLSKRTVITDSVAQFREDMDMFAEYFGEWFGDFIGSIKY
ncbi:AIPR family protein [Vibrio fluvialis]|uniref:AIPR family protein n=1 Tax=Vibrio fluvialis TaxID=676 RepID=UPI00192C11AF|nr:AIPR family protein [Vibrio fluvialis]ELL0574233.1 AIPR family protein [Vibrio fluvialis]MBL4307498.1 AIPR family protein [Vibrio fluvialis]MBY7971749.1 AIPR family protein [Vibrio fluvialis]MBY8096548.1 AIPR family protein [Vibrio fluvialis]